MKKAIVIGIVLIMSLFLITSCGAPQEDFDRVSNDLATAQAQIQSLQRQKNAAEAKLDGGKARIEVLYAILVPSITGELYQMTELEAANFLLEWRDKLVAIGDPILTRKFEALMYTGGSYEASMDFYLYLLESIEETLD